MSTINKRPDPLPAALTVRDSPGELDALWAMTPAERVEAMWAGTLTLSQLSKWTSRRPHEVPRLGREFAWIVIRTPEWDEPTDTRQDNVVHLPERSEHRAAA